MKKMMRKAFAMLAIMAMVVMVLLALPGGAGVAYAQEEDTPGALASMLTAFNLDINADVLYVNGGFAAGVGMNLVSFYDGAAHIRFEGVPSALMTTDADDGSLIGLGAGIDFKKIIEKFAGKSGAKWVAKMSPSAGLVLLMNINGEASMRPAFYITALKYPLD